MKNEMNMTVVGAEYFDSELRALVGLIERWRQLLIAGPNMADIHETDVAGNILLRHIREHRICCLAQIQLQKDYIKSLTEILEGEWFSWKEREANKDFMLGHGLGEILELK